MDREREASKMWRKDEALGGRGGAVEKHTSLLREDFETSRLFVQLQCESPTSTSTVCDTISETWICCPVETRKDTDFPSGSVLRRVEAAPSEAQMIYFLTESLGAGLGPGVMQIEAPCEMCSALQETCTILSGPQRPETYAHPRQAGRERPRRMTALLGHWLSAFPVLCAHFSTVNLRIEASHIRVLQPCLPCTPGAQGTVVHPHYQGTNHPGRQRKMNGRPGSQPHGPAAARHQTIIHPTPQLKLWEMCSLRKAAFPPGF